MRMDQDFSSEKLYNCQHLMGLSILLGVNNKHRKWLDMNFCKGSTMSFTTQINIFPREWAFIEGTKSFGERTGTFSCLISLDPFPKCEMDKWWQIHSIKQIGYILVKCVFIFSCLDSKEYRVNQLYFKKIFRIFRLCHFNLWSFRVIKLTFLTSQEIAFSSIWWYNHYLIQIFSHVRIWYRNWMHIHSCRSSFFFPIYS